VSAETLSKDTTEFPGILVPTFRGDFAWHHSTTSQWLLIPPGAVPLPIPFYSHVPSAHHRDSGRGWIIPVASLSNFRSRDCDWLRAGLPRGRSLSPGRVKNILFPTSPRPALGSTQPPIQWVTGSLSPGVKRPGREADHSPPASAEVKKMWIYTSTPSYVFMA
jgi:hypothetical protein